MYFLLPHLAKPHWHKNTRFVTFQFRGLKMSWFNGSSGKLPLAGSAGRSGYGAVPTDDDIAAAPPQQLAGLVQAARSIPERVMLST
jgi:hypothetical protein